VSKVAPGHAHNISKLNVIFAVSSVFLLFSTLWMIWFDYSREWKGFQRQFVQMERDLTARQIQEAQQGINQADLQSVQAELQQAETALAAEQAHPEVEPPQVISGTGSRFGEHTHVGGGGRYQRDRQLPKPFDDLSCSRRPARYGGGTAGMRQLIEGRGPDPEPPAVRVQQDVGVPDADAFRHPAVLVPDRLPVAFRETDQQARTGGAGGR